MPRRSVGRHLAETYAESSMRALSYPTTALPPCCVMMFLSELTTKCWCAVMSAVKSHLLPM